MEEEGLIKRFTIEVDSKKLGYPFEVLMHLQVKKPTRRLIMDELIANKNVSEIWEVTGDIDLIVHGFFKDSEEIDKFILNLEEKFPEIRAINTLIVLSRKKSDEPWF